MKKLIVLLVCLFALVGCSSSGKKEATIVVESVVDVSDTFVEETTSYLYEESSPDWSFVITLEPDGSFTLDEDSDEVEVLTGTYKISGNVLELFGTDELIYRFKINDAMTDLRYIKDKSSAFRSVDAIDGAVFTKIKE